MKREKFFLICQEVISFIESGGSIEYCSKFFVSVENTPLRLIFPPCVFRTAEIFVIEKNI